MSGPLGEDFFDSHCSKLETTRPSNNRSVSSVWNCHRSVDSV